MAGISVVSADTRGKPQQRFVLRVNTGTKKIVGSVAKPITNTETLNINVGGGLPPTRSISRLQVRSGKIYDIDGIDNPRVSPNWTDITHKFTYNTTKTWDLRGFLDANNLSVLINIDGATTGNSVIKDHKLPGNWGTAKVVTQSPTFRYLDLTGGNYSVSTNNVRTYLDNSMLVHTMIPGAAKPGFKVGQHYTTFYLWKPRSVRKSPGNAGLQELVLFNFNTLENISTSTNKLTGKDYIYPDRFNLNRLLEQGFGSDTADDSTVSAVSFSGSYPYLKNNTITKIDNVIEPVYDWQTLIVTSSGTTATSRVGTTKYYINGKLVASSSNVACGTVLYRLGLMDSATVATAKIHCAPGFLAQAGLLSKALTPEEAYALHLQLYYKVEPLAASQFLMDTDPYRVAQRYDDTFVGLPRITRLGSGSFLTGVKPKGKSFIKPEVLTVTTTSKENLSQSVSGKEIITVSANKLPSFVRESLEYWMY